MITKGTQIDIDRSDSERMFLVFAARLEGENRMRAEIDRHNVAPKEVKPFFDLSSREKRLD